MESIPALVRLVPGALLFHEDTYDKMKGRPQPVAEGARLLLLLGVALGLAGASQAILTWAASPSLAEAQRVLGREFWALPLVRRLGADGASAATAGQPWLGLALGWARPAPLMALWRLLLAPVGLLAGWLGCGLPAYALARLLGGRGGLGETLGCLALAEAPRVLLLVPVLPPLGLAGIGIWVWVLAARCQALRAAQGLGEGRALGATCLALLFLAWSALLVVATAALGAWLARGALP